MKLQQPTNRSALYKHIANTIEQDLKYYFLPFRKDIGFLTYSRFVFLEMGICPPEYNSRNKFQYAIELLEPWYSVLEYQIIFQKKVSEYACKVFHFLLN